MRLFSLDGHAQIDCVMKKLMFFKKISFAFIFLLFAYGQLQAQVLTIKDFTSLKSDLEKRIKANETQPGKTFRNLNNVNSKFNETYTDSGAIQAMVATLDIALDTIKTDNEDRAIIVKIKKQFSENINLPTNNSSTNPPKTTELDSIKTLNKKISSIQAELDSKYSKIWWIVPTCLAVLFLGLGIFFFINNSENVYDLERIRNERDNVKSDIVVLRTELNNLKRLGNPNQQHSNSENIINALKNEIAQLKEVLSSIEKDASVANSQTIVVQPPKVYYFSTPQPDGTFNDNNKSEIFMPTSSMYKFTLLSNNKANFEFINDESTLRDAINYPDSYLLPVCRAENTRNIKATKITTIGRGGIAELSNGKWNVTEKAAIRYE